MSGCACTSDNFAAQHHLSENKSAPQGALAAHVLAEADTPLSDLGIDVVLIRLEMTNVSIRASEALLSTEELRRAGRFVSDSARNRFIVARACLRKLLARRLGVRPDSVELRTGRFGKPALARVFPRRNLRFSLSRCGDIAAYAFSQGREIGVDIERVRVVRNADSIAARCFSRSECASYFALHPNVRSLGFLNCWTRKEAFVKAVGDGLSYPLGGFDVSLAPGAPAQLRRVGNVPGDQCGWQLRSIACLPGFVGAVAIERSIRGDNAA